MSICFCLCANNDYQTSKKKKILRSAFNSYLQLPTIILLLFVCLSRIFLDYFFDDSPYGSNEVVFLVLTMANLDEDLSRMSIGEWWNWYRALLFKKSSGFRSVVHITRFRVFCTPSLTTNTPWLVVTVLIHCRHNVFTLWRPREVRFFGNVIVIVSCYYYFVFINSITFSIVTPWLRFIFCLIQKNHNIILYNGI